MIKYSFSNKGLVRSRNGFWSRVGGMLNGCFQCRHPAGPSLQLRATTLVGQAVSSSSLAVPIIEHLDSYPCALAVLVIFRRIDL